VKKRWPEKPLGDVCCIERKQARHKGIPYVGLEHIESGTGKFVGTLSPTAVKSNTFAFTAGSVLFGRLRPYLKKVLLPTFAGHCSTEIFPLRPSEVLASEYLVYWLLQDSVIAAINGTCTGARMPRANMDAVMDFGIPVPPLPEQRRIVAILDEAFEGIAAAKANAEKNLRNTKDLFHGQSAEAFDRLGKANQPISLGELLERGWIEGHLDGNHGSDYPRKEEFTNHGVPYISANCLDGTEVNMSRCKYLSPARAAKLRKGIAQNGDVLFAHNATVGPVAILHTKEPKVILGTSLTYYRCNTAVIAPEYLALFMRSPGFVRQYEQVMRQSTRNQVPITKQREFFHVIPTIEEQRQIFDQFGGLHLASRRVEQILQHKLTALDELKSSLLHQAVKGQL
jgi:type I restriction enzyme S subunit